MTGCCKRKVRPVLVRAEHAEKETPGETEEKQTPDVNMQFSPGSLNYYSHDDDGDDDAIRVAGYVFPRIDVRKNNRGSRGNCGRKLMFPRLNAIYN